MLTFFVDFKSAYNCVNRDILYQILERERIFNLDEILFLKFIHGLVYFEVDHKKFHLINGVH